MPTITLVKIKKIGRLCGKPELSFKKFKTHDKHHIELSKTKIQAMDVQIKDSIFRITDPENVMRVRLRVLVANFVAIL